MEFYSWTQSLSVGSDVLDGHHKMLIDCLNQIHPLIDQPDKDSEIAQIMRRLEEFVLIHFSEEEQMMKKAGYPDWRAHKEQHDRMFEIVFDMKSDLEHGRKIDARHLFEVIYGWLKIHIIGDDQKYVSYLADPDPHPRDVWMRANGKTD